ncbi:MAG TPA: ABC-type transport auxiliary lipoprotein family protein [Dongiaceae bacterium]|nr:ABC-type transport auxiliary lipoprotein family protein [Dongiaceae bacterium]
MKRQRFVSCIALLAALAAFGCTKARAPRYYFLTAAPATAQPGVTQFPVSILVGRLSAPRILRDDRVVYGMGGVELGVDEYHRWTEPPTEMLEQLLVERLRRSGQYHSVQRISSSARGDFILRGHLSGFNEIDDASGSVKARFVIDLELFDVKKGTVVWTDGYSEESPVEKKSITSVVEALQKSVTTGIEKLSGDLAQYFASQPQQPAAH